MPPIAVSISTGAVLPAARNAPDQRQPVEPREHPVDHQRIEAALGRQEQSVATVQAGDDMVPEFAQAAGDESTGVGVVLDN
jgi:hypothetical protein